MKLISWNVSGHVQNVAEQVQALAHQEPHVVALQDVRTSAVSLYEKELTHFGFRHIIHTLHDAIKHPTGVLIASKFELEQLPDLPFSIIWPEGQRSPDRDIAERHWKKRTLFVTIHSPWGKIDLYNVYVTAAEHKEHTPNGLIPYPKIKLDLLSGIYHALSLPANNQRILCGDFHTPQEETSAGEFITWGYDKKSGGNYRLAWADQDLVERNILQGLEAFGMSDAYRRFHGYANCGSEEAYSWKKHRYDHIFTSQTLHPQSIEYLQNIRHLKLSDHTPIEVVFELKFA